MREKIFGHLDKYVRQHRQDFLGTPYPMINALFSNIELKKSAHIWDAFAGSLAIGLIIEEFKDKFRYAKFYETDLIKGEIIEERIDFMSEKARQSFYMLNKIKQVDYIITHPASSLLDKAIDIIINEAEESYIFVKYEEFFNVMRNKKLFIEAIYLLDPRITLLRGQVIREYPMSKSFAWVHFKRSSNKAILDKPYVKKFYAINWYDYDK